MEYKPHVLSIIIASSLYSGLSANETSPPLIGLYISADALYLKGSTNANTVATGTRQNHSTTSYGSAYNLKSHMNWGVDLTLGYKFGKTKKAEILSNWSHISSNWSQGPDSAGFVSPFFADSTTYQTVNSVKSSSHLVVNYYDLEAARSFSIGHSVQIKPSIGISGLTIRQNFSQELDGGDLTFVNNYDVNASTQGIGIVLGGSWDWSLGWGFSLVGSAKYSYLFEHLSIRNQRRDSNNQAIAYSAGSYKDSTHDQNYYVDFKLGLSWMREWYNGKLKTGLGAGWKMSNIQNGWNLGPGRVIGSTPVQGNLGFQGLYLNSYIGF